MKRLVQSFGLLMLVVGMMASSLSPVFAQNEPEGSPVATEEAAPVETEVVVPTETEVVSPASLENEDEGDVEATAIFTGILNLSTSDGADFPTDTTVSITNVTGGGSTPVVSGLVLFLGPSSPFNLPVIALPALPRNAVIQVDVTATGYLPFSQTYTLGNIAFFVSAELQLAPPTSMVSVGVVMSDNGPIPDGLTWTLFGDGWTTLQSGPVLAGGDSWSTVLPDPVEYGVYSLWITGAGYSAGQVLVVDAPTVGHTFTLDRLIPLAAVSVQITMTDAGLIPDGMTWSLQTTDYTEIEGGLVPDGSASGWTVPLTDTVPEGSYVLLVQNADQTYYYFYVVSVMAPETTLVVNFDRVIPQAAVSVQITMTDDGLIPDGMTWSFQTADNLYTEIEGGSVPDGSASGWTVPLTNTVPEGSYVLLVQNADQTYYYFYVVIVTAPETTLVVNFDRILDPTPTPTDVPTETPTVDPTETPTVEPTETPTDVPTETPTVAPTETATVAPTNVPTMAPTAAPTKAVATKTTTVTSLPNTGQGAEASAGFSSAMLALVAAVMLLGTAGAVGYGIRRHHR